MAGPTEITGEQGVSMDGCTALVQPMSADDVLRALTHVKRGTSPRAALQAALEMQEELTPRLIEVLSLAPVEVQTLCDSVPDEDTAFKLHEISMYLLAYWREPRGWQLILDFYVSDNDLAHELIDIHGTIDLPALLARCYDGSDLGYFERIIETPTFEAQFRASCLQAYHALVSTGQASRERFVAFLARQLDVPADAEPDAWYDWLAFRAALVQEPALRQAIEAVLDRGLAVYADSFLCLVSRKSLDAIYADDPNFIVGDILRDGVFDDLVASIANWSWFTSAEPVPWPPNPAVGSEACDSAGEAFATGQQWHSQPFVRTQRKFGRNEPCHCGSGKKYKKCCIAIGAAVSP